MSWEVVWALFCRWHLAEGDTGTIQISGLGTVQVSSSPENPGVYPECLVSWGTLVLS